MGSLRQPIWNSLSMEQGAGERSVEQFAVTARSGPKRTQIPCIVELDSVAEH
jgi:hypothetical protein